MTTYLVRNMDAFKAILGELEEDHCGKWAVIHSGELVGIYETDEDAANAADGCKGPSLIRQICPPLTITYVAMPVFNDDCWDENGNLDLDNGRNNLSLLCTIVPCHLTPRVIGLMTAASCGFDNNPGMLVRVGPTLTAQVGYDPSFLPSTGNRPEISMWPLEAGGQRHSVIVGRDFLRQFKLIYDGRTGEVSLSND